MKKIFLLYVWFPILVAVVINEYRKPLLRILRSKLLQDTEKYKLVIGVLSARENFKQRQTIRETWWNSDVFSGLMGKVMLKFVVGGEACLHPPDFRQTPYCCNQWNITSDISQEHHTALLQANSSVEQQGEISSQNVGINKLYFRVHHSVVIHKLGIHSDSMTRDSHIRLFDMSSGEEIFSAALNSSSKVSVIDGYNYVSVQPLYVLPAGFEGLILAERVHDTIIGEEEDLPVSNRDIHSVFNSGGGLIEQLDMTAIPISKHLSDLADMNRRHFVTVSFMFSVHDKVHLNHRLETREATYERWSHLKYKEQQTLTQEIAQYEDILLVPSVDVYRQLSAKLLLLYSWLAAETQAEFVMKTDDDCYVDVHAIYTQLQEQGIFGSRTWWGRFRHNWPVETHGKWREEYYPAPGYPAFACGAGYVVAGDIAAWLTENSDQLASYQGEDTSMGIWLAAIGPDRVDDARWLCDPNLCRSDLLVMPDLTELQILNMWKHRQECGNPCGCLIW